MKRLLLTACCLALVAGRGRADLDPEVNKPYHLVVVLSVARQPQFSTVFREQIKRQLRDFLQGALDKMGDVEVITDDAPRPAGEAGNRGKGAESVKAPASVNRQYGPGSADVAKLLDKVKADGLKKALDGLNDISDTKLHFVLISSVHGSNQHDHYLIQTRQYDGMTGIASPVRVARLPDPSGREDVGKMAVRLVYQDFGLIGTIAPQAGDKRADIVMKLKGGQRAQPIERWIKAGDVFAVSLVSQHGPKLRAERVDWAFVKVTSPPQSDDPSQCRCKLFYRYKPNPVSAQAGVLGVRAVKLGTIATRLQLRLLNDVDRVPVFNITVNVGAEGYGLQGNEGPTTNPDGLVQTGREYQGLAFVQVLDGGSIIAQIPVPVVDHEIVTIPVPIDKDRVAAGDFNVRHQILSNRINEYMGVINDYVKDLNKLGAKLDELDAAVRAAESYLKDMQEQIAALEGEIKALKEEGLRLAKEKGGVADLEDALNKIRKARDDMDKYKNNMEKIITDLKDPRRREAQVRVQNAIRRLTDADVPEALTEYRKAAKILQEIGPDAKAELEKLNGRINELDKEWQAGQQPNNRAARRFFYTEWLLPDTSQDIGEQLAEAQKNLEICNKNRDRFALAKASQAAVNQTKVLQRELKQVSGENGEDATKRRKTIEEVAKKLAQFYKHVDMYLAELNPKEK